MAVSPIPAPPGATLSPDGLYWWDGTRWVPCAAAPAPPAQPAAGVPARGRSRDVAAAVAVAAGAALAAVGAFLPWASASTFGFTLSRSGVDGGDGWFSLGGAALALLVAWRFNSGGSMRAARVLGFVAAACIAIVAGVDMSDIGSRLSAVNDSGFVVAQIGNGLYLSVVAAAVVVIGVLMSWRRLPG